MSNYRRIYQPGAKFFFTVVTYKRQQLLINDISIFLLKIAFQKVIKTHPFTLEAITILPDHIHSIWHMPEDDHDYSTRWRLIKTYFSKHFITASNNRKEKEIWQSRFWEHLIRDEYDWEAHMNYIHYNSVKHGYAETPKDWQYSSFHRYVKKGYYDINWGNNKKVFLIEKDYGE